MPSVRRDDRILAYTRRLSLVIVPFLIAAFVILYLFPGDSGRLFAWPIRPTMTAMVLAAAYLGGAYFFIRVQFLRSWTAVAHGYPPVALFAALLGVATALHWDKFTHNHPAFWTWATLYFAAPPMVLIAWLVNRRYAAPPAPGDLRLGPVARWILGGVGAIALIQGVVMFADPALVIPFWPWTLTPLTARVMAAVLCLGTAGVLTAVDGRWRALRLLIEVALVMLALIGVAAARAHGEMLTQHLLTWPLAGGLAAVTVAAIAYYARMTRAQEAQTPP